MRSRSGRAIRIAIISVSVAQSENRVDEHPGTDDRDQTPQEMDQEMRLLGEGLLTEKQKPDREKSGAGAHQNKNENQDVTKVLLLRPSVKFIGRRGEDG